MGRYLERSENLTRLLLVTEDISSETQGWPSRWPNRPGRTCWRSFPRPTWDRRPRPRAHVDGVPGRFYLDAGNPYSVHYSLRRARENARSVREALTVEVFLALNETFRALEAHARRGLGDPPSFRDALTSTHKGLFTIVGAIEHTFTRDQGWLFLKLGEALERVYRTALILRAKLPGLAAAEPRADVALYYTQWRTLLRALGSLENYRRSYGARLEPELVVPFLLLDPHSPRSLRYGLEAVKDQLERIAGGGEPTAAVRLVGRLHADLAYQDQRVAGGGADTAFLERVVDIMGQTHDALSAQYFVT